MACLQRKTMDNVIGLHTTSAKSTSTSAVFHDFAQNTSLLGIQHFLRNKSFVWLLAYLLCVAMSIIQSWSVTINFFQQNTYHSSTVVSKTLLPFPSVTVCTGTVLKEDFNFSSIPDFNFPVYKKLLQECGNDDAMQKMAHTLEDNRNAVQKYMRTLSERRRLELGLNLTRVLKECKLGTLSCNISDPSDFHMYSCPHYGNCFTFNPAYKEASAKFFSPSDYLHVTFRFPSQGYWLTRRSNAKMSVHIHPPGTVPFMEGPEVMDVFADQIATVSITLESETLSIKKRSITIPSCVNSDDEIYRRKSIFYKERSPYLYSQEACLVTCTQELYAKCDAVLPYIPVQSEEYELGKNIIFYPDCHIGPVDMEICDCPIPCRKLEYRVLRDYNDVYNVPCQTEKVPMLSPTTEPDINETTEEYKNEARITLSLRSNIYQKIEEHLSCGLYFCQYLLCLNLFVSPSYTRVARILFEYLGILGGNISLWVGLCIISVLELFELFVKVMVAAMRSRKNSLHHRLSKMVLPE